MPDGHDRSLTEVRLSLLEYLQKAVKMLLIDFSPNEVKTDNIEVAVLCDSIERLILFEVTGSLWDLITASFFSSSPFATFQSTIDWIESEAPDDAERGRAFMRMALNKKILSRSLDHFKTTSRWRYKDESIFQKEDDWLVFINIINSLDSMDFNLNIIEQDLLLLSAGNSFSSQRHESTSSSLSKCNSHDDSVSNYSISSSLSSSSSSLPPPSESSLTPSQPLSEDHHLSITSITSSDTPSPPDLLSPSEPSNSNSTSTSPFLFSFSNRNKSASSSSPPISIMTSASYPSSSHSSSFSEVLSFFPSSPPSGSTNQSKRRSVKRVAKIEDVIK